MSKKLTPNQSEADSLMFSLYSIDAYKWSARDIRSGIAAREDGHYTPNIDLELRWALDEALPTYSLIKLAAVIEECTIILWNRRFPEINHKKFSQDERLKLLQALHHIDVTAFMELWTLRNKCVHNSTTSITWNQFDTHFKKVWDFVEQFASEPSLELRAE
jgi:hypothetical protein